jgi:hypothetical protein
MVGPAVFEHGPTAIGELFISAFHRLRGAAFHHDGA